MEPLPDLAAMSDHDLKKLIDELTEEEQEISYRRRLLHGKIDILRAELVARLQKSEGKSVLEQVDVEGLARILAGKASPVRDLLLLFREVVDQLLEVVVGQAGQIGERFHVSPFVRRGALASKAAAF